MDYIEFKITSNTDFNDILIAELGEIGFESFEETASDLKAYIQEVNFSEDELKEMLGRYADFIDSDYAITTIPKINWNEEWEKSFSPVEVNKSVYIRASFHEPKPEFTHEIVINPKMSFGTGHHDTTFQMALQQLETDHVGKNVLDMGSGTGILAILAEKLGAEKTLAIDIDDWSVENGIENVELNKCEKITFIKGDASSIKDVEDFDLILANINLNILKNDIPEYIKKLKEEGILIVSGFYKQDLPELEKITSNCGLTLKKVIVSDKGAENNWVAVSFTKIN